MAAISKEDLKLLLKQAFDDDSDVQINPAEARERQAEKIADAIEQYVIGRTTIVTGTSQSGGAVTGQGIIQ